MDKNVQSNQDFFHATLRRMSIGVPHLNRLMKRGIGRGIRSAMREEGWGASVASLFGVLFLGQVLVLLVYGVHGGLTLLREQTDIRLEIVDGASQTQVQDLVQNIRTQEYVEDIVYITKQEAYERQKKREPQLIAFLQKFGIENPYPETLGVRLKSLDDYPTFLSFLQQPSFAKVVNPTFLSQTTDQERQIYRLLDIITSARLLLFCVVGLLLVVLLFTIIELVRRRAIMRSEELFVEQLVGASPGAMLIPFCGEVMTLMSLAFILSVGCTFACLFLLPLLLPSLSTGGLFAPWVMQVRGTLLVSLPWLLIGELAALTIISTAGTAAALWSRLQTTTLSIA